MINEYNQINNNINIKYNKIDNNYNLRQSLLMSIDELLIRYNVMMGSFEPSTIANMISESFKTKDKYLQHLITLIK